MMMVVVVWWNHKVVLKWLKLENMAEGDSGTNDKVLVGIK